MDLGGDFLTQEEQRKTYLHHNLILDKAILEVLSIIILAIFLFNGVLLADSDITDGSLTNGLASSFTLGATANNGDNIIVVF